MRVDLIRASELSNDQIALWTQFQDQDATLASPYFSCHFTLAVGRVRGDSFVGIIEDGGKIVGFFPFQLQERGIGKPIGGPVSDYHGVIAARDAELNALDLLSACGLYIYDFNHMLAAQSTFQPFLHATAISPYLDLSRGYDAYVSERQRQGSTVVNTRMATKWRTLERDLGPLRFELHDLDVNSLKTLMYWKSRQYSATRATDVFSFEWPVRLLEEIYSIKEQNFAGLMSTIYAGDRLIAAHMGMRSRDVWHYWFPAYDVECSKFSPGLRLLVEMAKSAESQGLKVIDLGKGEAEYKIRLSNGFIVVGEGYVARPSLVSLARKFRRTTEAIFGALPLGPISMWPKKFFRRLERSRRFH